MSARRAVWQADIDSLIEEVEEVDGSLKATKLTNAELQAELQAEQVLLKQTGENLLAMAAELTKLTGGRVRPPSTFIRCPPLGILRWDPIRAGRSVLAALTASEPNRRISASAILLLPRPPPLWSGRPAYRRAIFPPLGHPPWDECRTRCGNRAHQPDTPNGHVPSWAAKSSTRRATASGGGGGDEAETCANPARCALGITIR